MEGNTTFHSTNAGSTKLLIFTIAYSLQEKKRSLQKEQSAERPERLPL
jgi:hypothetical protein